MLFLMERQNVLSGLGRNVDRFSSRQRLGGTSQAHIAVTTAPTLERPAEVFQEGRDTASRPCDQGQTCGGGRGTRRYHRYRIWSMSWPGTNTALGSAWRAEGVEQRGDTDRVSHVDDEVLGCSSFLQARSRDTTVLYATRQHAFVADADIGVLAALATTEHPEIVNGVVNVGPDRRVRDHTQAR